MEKYPLIRKIYLYLFTLVGLSLMVIGGVKLVDLGLKMTIFKQADLDRYSYQKMPSCSVLPLEKINSVASGESSTLQLTEEEKSQMKRWLQDYKTWEEEQKNIDPLNAQRQRDASNSIAMMIVGLPLYLYHWRVIKKETKEA